jgi:NAD(P)H-hydrate epimerase
VALSAAASDHTIQSPGETNGSMSSSSVTYITAAQAAEIDAKLMGPAYGFSIDQLMELAGLSIASALQTVYPPASHRRVLVLAGPGNNGGDGLVAGRHLHHFGYDVQAGEGARCIFWRLARSSPGAMVSSPRT